MRFGIIRCPSGAHHATICTMTFAGEIHHDSPSSRAIIFDLGGVVLHWKPLQRLQRHGLAAERSAFVDGHRPTVETARRLGMHAVAFESTAQCAAELRPWLAAGA